jgi:hypothetical protein
MLTDTCLKREDIIFTVCADNNKISRHDHLIFNVRIIIVIVVIIIIILIRYEKGINSHQFVSIISTTTKVKQQS